MGIETLKICKLLLRIFLWYDLNEIYSTYAKVPISVTPGFSCQNLYPKRRHVKVMHIQWT